MWDFSWLERRWPRAGYEDWDRALDELAERGYDAVRIDAYPHLVAAGPEREWELPPMWNQSDWGSPALCRVQVMPALLEFIGKCAMRGIKVALSTWFREDATQQRLLIPTPSRHAEIWTTVLDHIRAAGLLDAILYVDFCNEWPLKLWAPFFRNDPDPDCLWTTPASIAWMKESIRVFKGSYPDLRCCYSFTTELQNWRGADVSDFDLLELHIWMAQQSDFYKRVGYSYERFESKGYENLVRFGERLYRSDESHWQAALIASVANAAEWSRACGKRLVTTECWGIVDYKDWPLLDWGWVKELCVLGVEEACATGCWEAVATSNFCGPQFVGMWRDVEWHQRLTGLIKASSPPGQQTNPLPADV